ncbi:MAG: helix-turn-helix domain-containing protein, partial [Desulfomonilia bacterium]|nr:helix-turn-helix domain-containing protein [Desulfomonilia bacterium]
KLVADARSILDDAEQQNDEGLYKMLQVKLGMPKNKILLRLLETGRIRKEFDAFDLEMSADYNKKRLYALKEELFFTVDEKQRSSDLTERGRTLLRPDNPDAFVLPDLPTIMRFSAGSEDAPLRSLAEEEAAYIRKVLASVGGNKSRAARILDIDRKTLREKIRQADTPPE